MMIPIKVYDNMNNLKNHNVNLTMALNFAFVRNPNYYKCNNPNNPLIHAFTLPKTSVK
jgi:hypothetical protein